MQLHRAQALRRTPAQRQQALHSSSLAAQLRYIDSRHDSCNPELSKVTKQYHAQHHDWVTPASAVDVERYSYMTQGAHVLSKSMLQFVHICPAGAE